MPAQARKTVAPESDSATATPVALSGTALRIALDTAPALRMTAGQTIERATFLTARMAEGGEYGAYPVAFFNVDGNVVALHAFHTILRNKIVELAPKPGEDFTIHYVGERETNKTLKLREVQGDSIKPNDITTYHNYSIFRTDEVEAPAETLDWSTVGTVGE